MYMVFSTNTNVEQKKALAHLLWNTAIAFFDWQLRAGRKALLEHPQCASSWLLESTLALRRQYPIKFAVFDQCRFDLRAPCSRLPIKKRTQFMSRGLPTVQKTFNGCNCKGEKHRTVQGSEGSIRISTWPQKYPPSLVRAMVTAIAEDIREPMEESD